MSEVKVKCIKCQSEKVNINRRSTGQYLCTECGTYFTISNRQPKPEKPKDEWEDYDFLTPLNKVCFSTTTNQSRIQIVPVGDIHLGANECDWEKFTRELKYIQDTPDTYMIGMGDYCNFASKNSNRKGPSVYQDSLNPMEQYKKLIEVLQPLASAGKIIGLLKGNHEEWINEDSGIDITALLCDKLSVDYMGNACDVSIKVGNLEYLGYALHGSSAAKSGATKMNALLNATKDIMADFYLMGHVHQVGVTKAAKWVGGTMQKKYYVLTGSFLRWEHGYAQCWGLSPNPTGVAKICLYTDRMDIHVSV